MTRRTERVIVYVTPDSKKRWRKALVDMEVRSGGEALELLLDLYEAASEYLGERRLRELVEKMRGMPGVRLRVAR